MKKPLLICLSAILIGLILLIAKSNPNKHSRAEIDQLSRQLFEFGSVNYVHSLTYPAITEYKALFEKVEQGNALSFEETCEYRAAYLQALQDHRLRFKAVDGDIHFATDFGMTIPNNCSGTGVSGNHDLHDVSANKNLDALQKGISNLTQGAGWWRRVVLINGIHKNLVDVLVHMSPLSHSIGVRSPSFKTPGTSEISQHYARMQTAFKTAQFLPINSTEYWLEIDTALLEYGEMAWKIQTVVFEHSTPIQRKISGRWMAIQTLAPRVNLSDCVRPQTSTIAKHCD